MSANIVTKNGNVVEEPNWVKWLISDTRAGWLWLVLRVWLGWQWIQAGEHKIFDAGWVDGGMALKGFWEKAVLIPEAGRPAIAFDWYRSFIQMLLDAEAYTWFAPLVAYGEVLIGVALIVGAFTGIAAFFGAFMNWNFMMAGAASTNPMLLAISIGLILAWKVSGYIGLDFVLLRWLGTPWQNEPAATFDTPVAAPAK